MEHSVSDRFMINDWIGRHADGLEFGYYQPTPKGNNIFVEILKEISTSDFQAAVHFLLLYHIYRSKLNAPFDLYLP
jgi:hypothetical protein